MGIENTDLNGLRNAIEELRGIGWDLLRDDGDYTALVCKDVDSGPFSVRIFANIYVSYRPRALGEEEE